jgi:hypothetical protein
MNSYTIFYEPKWLKRDKMSNPFETLVDADSEQDARDHFRKFYSPGRIVRMVKTSSPK